MARPESFDDRELRMAALAVAHETAPKGQTIGGVLYAAEQVYRFLAGGAVVAGDGMVRVVSAQEALTRH